MKKILVPDVCLFYPTLYIQENVTYDTNDHKDNIITYYTT